LRRLHSVQAIVTITRVSFFAIVVVLEREPGRREHEENGHAVRSEVKV
jgi:hypothetical protein